MACESKRGCGYRKVGGIYLVSDGTGQGCDRLPFPLGVCPCCSAGIKRARGWTWIDVDKLFQGPHMIKDALNAEAGEVLPCECGATCVLCSDPASMGKAGLIWIGEQFYKTPEDFTREGVAQGFSRRISKIPRGFKVGETWVLLAHVKGFPTQEKDDKAPIFEGATKLVHKPGIFFVWRPARIEKIFNESDRNSDKVAKAEKQGMTPVFFPDDDKDHHDSKKKSEAKQ